MAERVKKGVVDQRAASPMCSVSQTPTGAPVPQAGRVCSATKVRASHTPEQKRSSRYTRETQLAGDQSEG